MKDQLYPQSSLVSIGYGITADDSLTAVNIARVEPPHSALSGSSQWHTGTGQNITSNTQTQHAREMALLLILILLTDMVLCAS